MGTAPIGRMSNRQLAALDRRTKDGNSISDSIYRAGNVGGFHHSNYSHRCLGEINPSRKTSA